MEGPGMLSETFWKWALPSHTFPLPPPGDCTEGPCSTMGPHLPAWQPKGSPGSLLPPPCSSANAETHEGQQRLGWCMLGHQQAHEWTVGVRMTSTKGLVSLRLAVTTQRHLHQHLWAVKSCPANQDTPHAPYSR